jgi:hypothetical protein
MPYELPTASQFKTRFPIFEDKDDALVTMIIAEASASVDSSWAEADYQPAIMYLAAHLLATDNSAEGESVIIGGSAGGGIASESFGGMSISYDKGSSANSAASNSKWGSTEYGRRFYDLLVRNKPAIVSI